MYDTIARQHFHFQDLRIDVIKSGNISNKQRFTQPLLELARSKDKELFSVLELEA